ncbi:hypothetical protein C8F04DRAFT_111043 [Mycena alexandri]|uniref:Uncharacterized protein n=1 Tax=Mycena alexandri TaxID=1745969 RepID=A0AAD6XE37_9AGAR|nr:hypothetical protein C8F04DRAFT_111043 [Mycena alexandri]
MPAIQARDSSKTIGLLVGIIIGSIVLIIGIVVLVLSLLKRRRTVRYAPPPSTLEEFMSKAQRERQNYLGHRNNDSVGSESSGPLLHQTRHWEPQLPAQPSGLPPLRDNARYSYGAGDEDHELGPQVHAAPTTSTRSPPPGLHVAIPQSSAPIPTKSVDLPPLDDSPASLYSADSDSMYSQRSASTRMQTVDLSSPATRSPAPPVPALPQYLRPRSELPPEEPPLTRGDTVIVATLLKSRAKRLTGAPERSGTRTSRIERADSIREAPSPTSADEPTEHQRSWRRVKALPVHTLTAESAYSADSVDPSESFDETLEYYTSQLIDSPASPVSVASYDTVRPTRPAV